MSEQGGRIFFARSRRAPDRDSEIRLLSMGVDIGSATSHLALSRLVLQRRGNQTKMIRRELLHQSEILLTPYLDDHTIDTEALAQFIAAQYRLAEISPAMIDTGALLLTGLAAQRQNAHAIGTLFAAEAGRLVAVAAGDGLETTLAAHGSGAVAASRAHGARVMAIDIGGGTSKIALCAQGAVIDLTALDIGARLVCLDAEARVVRIEPAAEAYGLHVGDIASERTIAAVAEAMAERLLEACGAAAMTPATSRLLRLPALQSHEQPDRIILSGGVAEYAAGREQRSFGDLGPALAKAVLARLRAWGPAVEIAEIGLRATVIGASQYTVQLSGHTIFIQPASVLPLRNLPVIAPVIDWSDPLDAKAVAQAVQAALLRLSLADATTPVAVAYRWQGAASHARLQAFVAGLAEGLAALLQHGVPLVLLGERDVAGLLGLHCSEAGLAKAVVSIDGISARECDFIDIGELLQVSGGVPVVVKSLVFPPTTQAIS